MGNVISDNLLLKIHFNCCSNLKYISHVQNVMKYGKDENTLGILGTYGTNPC